MALHQKDYENIHIMQENRSILNLSTNMASPISSDEEMIADVDEPPDDQHTPRSRPSRIQRITTSSFSKSTLPHPQQRKESLLTNAIKYTENTSPTEERPESTSLNRGLSCASTWSNNSTGSTAELTSDGGFTSPRTATPSPPPPPSTLHNILPVFNKKPFDQPVSIIRHDDENIGPLQKAPVPSENSVEASLGRKRCITFACGKKDAPKAQPAANPTKTSNIETTEAPKRTCTIKFACPSKVSTEGPATGNKPRLGRAVSPAPLRKLRGTPKASPKSHRDSDSTVRNESPVRVRKSSYVARPRKLSTSSDLVNSEAFRFHEFASSEEEIDEWLQESTCHRSRLTINDTLKVENTLRQLGEEVEEEALEEEEEEEEQDAEDDEDDDDEDMDDDDLDGEDEDDDEGEASDVSDEGFQTDDEEGFAGSDDDSDAGSDYHWWAPGHSTAATSVEHLEHIRPSGRRSASDSSIASADSASDSMKKHSSHSSKRKKSRPVNIRVPSPELPDSTDFVCGTLDEDRPLEDAYISCLERRRAAKHKLRPQDIDPSFPTSDPEMDEEDEDDDDNIAEESDQHLMMHGQMDPHLDQDPRGRRSEVLKKRSPAQSPKRLRSPPPKRSGHRSPPPRRLFGHSPKRMRSPAPTRLRSPPPTRRPSIITSPQRNGPSVRFAALAERPPITVAASLPRTPISAHPTQDESDDDTSVELPLRGAIDIKVGLENKRLRRKEKLYQKLHRKGCKDKEKRPAPGKGCEKMREMGLGLAAHKGKGTGLPFAIPSTTDQKDMHMLSV